MTYQELINLYKNNEFRKIDKEDNCKKFYLLRSISKAKTLQKFCDKYELENDLDAILANKEIDEKKIISFIKAEFKAKTEEEISQIESELNKMQNFDWGGSKGNSLEKNIVNNYVKKLMKHDEITGALTGSIQQSVCGYTLNSWYNHWSTIMIEEIFNNNKRVLPTLDLIKNIDFFVDSVPFDLKVTYFPKGLMKEKIGDSLYRLYGSKSELTCSKKIARKCNITIPTGLSEDALTICLYNLLNESIDDTAKEFLKNLYDIKKEIIDYYVTNPEELVKWLYENQGEMRFDAANRIYLVLIDSNNMYDSWKLKRNVKLLKKSIDEQMDKFDDNDLHNVSFTWDGDGKTYDCKAKILFVVK
ncbi:MAG: hypothetical protein IJO60_03170 [Agathobacter sp.]|nr:hypothetical protein [Agathobacter sp.]